MKEDPTITQDDAHIFGPDTFRKTSNRESELNSKKSVVVSKQTSREIGKLEMAFKLDYRFETRR